jgi:Dolichyl-phosphate-mannose-protein mannosyltransferase
VGRRLTRRIVFASTPEKWLVATALGLASIGHVLFLLGLAGLLAPLPVGVLLAGTLFLCRSEWREGWNDARRVRARFSSRGSAAIALAAAVMLSLLLWFALYPPVSFDSTMYHLPYAKAFVATGELPFLASLRHPVFPQLMEVLFAGMLLFADDVAAQLLQLLATLLTAGLVFVWGRDAFGRTVAWLAAAVYLGNPIAAYLAGTAFVEPGLGLFAAAAVYAIRRWRGSRERAWLILASVFAASAAATKYLGLFFVAAIAVIVVSTPAPRARWRDALRFAAVAAVVLVPWYGRIFLFTGNPVFPYFPTVFGSSPWEHVRYPSRVSTVLSILTLPWDLTFRRETFTWHPPVSPFYLLALPLTLVAAVRDARVRRMLLFTVAYAAFARFVSRDPRYLVPILPLASLTAGAGFALLPMTRRFLPAAVFLLLLPGGVYVAWQIGRLGPLPATAQQRREFLARQLPAYPAIDYLNRTRGRDYSVYAFHAENMAYFADGKFLGDWFGPASFAKIRASARTPEALHSRLRALGVDHLLVVKNRAPALPLVDPRFAERFRSVYTDAHTRVFALAFTSSGPPSSSGRR